MIPEIFVEKWRDHAKWQTLGMIEQDLIISRALICLFNNLKIKNSLLFRGGTALNKIYIKPAARYSEDLDFVQRRAEPIGETLTEIQNVLNDWLGEPKRKITERCAKLVYKYQDINGFPAKLKIEINTTEHLQVQPIANIPFHMDSEWFKGECLIASYSLEELMATKIRALYQRRKGRDLFDIWLVFANNLARVKDVIPIFNEYCLHEGTIMTRTLFQKNLEVKRLNKDFQMDMNVLLPHNTNWDFDLAFAFVQNNIITQIE